MNDLCKKVHGYFNGLPHYHFPFNPKEIPKNGIYILFQKDEQAHGTKRIVRIGTHTGKNQLPSRLIQHFINENKDRSIFRKNIGRCLLAQKNDPYLKIWELDSTPRENRKKYAKLINIKKQKIIEGQISKYLQKNFSFAILPIADKNQRLSIEAGLIALISRCPLCKPSKKWLGNFSPKEKIRKSGLWQVNELYKKSLTRKEFERFISKHNSTLTI